MSQETSSLSEGYHADVTLVRDDARHRYELRVGGELAVLMDFRDRPGHVDLIHTEAQPGFAGKGLAKVLARYALDDVVASGKRIIPHCGFVARFIRSHPDSYDQYTDFP